MKTVFLNPALFKFASDKSTSFKTESVNVLPSRLAPTKTVFTILRSSKKHLVKVRLVKSLWLKNVVPSKLILLGFLTRLSSSKVIMWFSFSFIIYILLIIIMSFIILVSVLQWITKQAIILPSQPIFQLDHTHLSLYFLVFFHDNFLFSYNTKSAEIE